jgi:hypothetical protein
MPTRSASEVARILGKAEHAMTNLCTRRNWTERAADWDRELDRRIQKAQLSEVERMVKRQTQLALGLQEAATHELHALVERIKTLEGLAKKSGRPRVPITTVKDIVRLVEAGTKLERLNRNMPDGITALVDPTGKPIDTIKLEFVKTPHYGEDPEPEPEE